MRNRLFTLLLLPGILFLWAIGWSLYWIGDQKTTRKQMRKKEPENVQVMANLFPEQEIRQ